MQQFEKQRAKWVDIAKGMAIITIVWFHAQKHHTYTSDLSALCSHLLSWWYVPVFFIIGGFFITEEKLQNPSAFIKAKLTSIYSLLLRLYIPAVLLHNVFLHIGWYDTQTDYEGKRVAWWGFSDHIVKLAEAVCFMGREPILGALWFVYVLVLALCAYALISWSLRKLCHTTRIYEWVRFGFLLSCCIASSVLTHIFDISIPRFNITLTAIWWIYLGHQLHNRLRVEFSSFSLFLVSLTTYVLSTLPWPEGPWAAVCQETVRNTLAYVCALYAVCYVARRMERLPIISNALAYCGRESFYIMGLHFVGFKAAAYLLLLLGVPTSLSALCPSTHGYAWIVALCLFFGVMLPIALARLIHLTKNR